MTDIHPSAIVSPKAEIGNDVSIGPYAIIEENVVIGDGCQIGSSALVASGARLGKNVKMFHCAVVGTQPQDLKFGGEETEARVGDNCILREFVTVNRGTEWRGYTEVGHDCLMMAYAHVAHDCLIGHHAILANAVNLGGHVEIGEWAICGGVLAVHQFVKIGAHAMIGGGFRVVQDACPYALLGGYPLKVMGLNAVGLERRGFSPEKVKTLNRTFKLLFFKRLNTTQAIEKIRNEVEMIPEVEYLLDFIAASTRGIIKH
jgi:UDP-N-acetylglucosamine acyltransferase